MDTLTFYSRLDEVLEVESGSVQGSTELDTIDAWDSIAILSFIAMVDTHYQVAVPAKELNGCHTVDDLLALVQARLGD